MEKVRIIGCLWINPNFRQNMMEIIFDKNYITFVGANGIRPPMIQINFPVYGTMALVAVRSFISSGFNINLPLTPGFESGFTGLQRTSSIWV